jgi:tRNA pseudouridine38-40 synthase
LNTNTVRYFIDIAFNGSGFSGWQSQPGSPTVQQTLAAAIASVLGDPGGLTGAGRTDAGVHALQMIAHFDGPARLQLETSSFIQQLEKQLPASVRIRGLQAVRPESHARFDALSRTYHYLVDRQRSPFLKGLAMDYYGPLNLDAMQAAAEMLVGKRDFACFARSGSDVNNHLCDVKLSRWYTDEDVLVYEIKANRFLRNMVRAIVGTLIDVGRGRFSLDYLEEILASGSRSLAGTSAPAHGLYLWKVDYPEEVYSLGSDEGRVASTDAAFRSPGRSI